MSSLPVALPGGSDTVGRLRRLCEVGGMCRLLRTQVRQQLGQSKETSRGPGVGHSKWPYCIVRVNNYVLVCAAEGATVAYS